MSIEQPCLTPNCPRKYTRGKRDGSARSLRGPCYQVASRMVKSGKTTWRELEDLGLTQPPIRKKTEKKTLFEQVFETRKQKSPQGSEEEVKRQATVGLPLPCLT